MRKQFLLLFLFFSVSVSSFSQSRYISETTKKVVYARDGGKCQCCGSSVELEYDHILPFSHGGSNDVSNIQLLCQKCNRSKSNNTYCKIHHKKVGKTANENTSAKSKSSVSSNTCSTSQTMQCSGITKKGTRCKNKTINQNGKCHLHT